MCIRNIPTGAEGDCACTSGRGGETPGKEELLINLKEYKKKLKTELIAVNTKLKSADNAGKGGE